MFFYKPFFSKVKCWLNTITLHTLNKMKFNSGKTEIKSGTIWSWRRKQGHNCVNWMDSDIGFSSHIKTENTQTGIKKYSKKDFEKLIKAFFCLSCSFKCCKGILGPCSEERGGFSLSRAAVLHINDLTTVPSPWDTSPNSCVWERTHTQSSVNLETQTLF